jgi:hypothetical protein
MGSQPSSSAVFGDCGSLERPSPVGGKKNSARRDLEPSVLKVTREGTVVNTDEWAVCVLRLAPSYGRYQGSVTRRELGRYLQISLGPFLLNVVKAVETEVNQLEYRARSRARDG